MRNLTSTVSGATTGNVSSAWFYVGNMSKFSVITNVSGATSPDGTVSLYVSNEVAENGTLTQPFTPTIYGSHPSFSQTVSTNATLISQPYDLAYQWARLVFTFGSGGASGTINMTLAAHD
jgi:hypothetical protein